MSNDPAPGALAGLPGKGPGLNALVLWLVMVQGALAAGGFEAAVEAGRRGDFAEAYCVWKPLAERGHAASQYHLGWMYANGQGLAVDEERAVRWWTAAARQGHVDSQFRLGLAYLYGEGAEKDGAAAVRWFLAAARSGDDEAGSVLRRLAAEGEETAKAEALKLLVEEPALLGGALLVEVDRGNLRERPSTESRVIGTLHRGSTVVELGRRGDWVQVGLPGEERLGWAHRSLLGDVTTP